MFFKKFFNKSSKKIFAECDNWAVRKYSPILPAQEFSPPGYDKLSSFVRKEKHAIDSTKTVKVCPGIRDYLNLGYVIPAWCDIEIFPSDDNQYAEVRYSDPVYNHAVHPPSQTQDFMQEKFKIRSAVKLDNPWRLWTAKGYSTLFLPMYYWPNRNWEAVSGVQDTDLGALISPINIMLKENKYTIIKQGEPLVHIIPFKREEIVCETRDITDTGRRRHYSIASLHNLSFGGWIKYMRDKKLFKIDRKDIDLPE